MRILSVLITILLLTASAWSQQKVTIHQKQPSLLPAHYKQHDVVIFKSVFPEDNSYSVAFYRIENDSLRLFQTYYVTHDRFDVAYYKWQNDTIVSIRLYNSKTRKDKAFKVFGRGGSTGVLDH
jgi:hypothetical protein